MKKRRMKKLNNKGYSLIELIIVIAIIVVLTGAALVTMSVMHSAKAKEAAITFDSEISELVHNSKNMACDVNDDGIIDATDDGYSFAIRMHSDGSKTYLQQVVVKNGAYVSVDDYEKANNPNKGDGISLSSYVYVKYTDYEGNVTVLDTAGSDLIISFDRKGMCTAGYGTYDFIRTSGGDQVACVTINKNGSHQSK